MFNEKKYIEKTLKFLKSSVKGKVLVAVSGGVDSTVSAALLKKAGVDCVNLFINTGFLRKEEENQILKNFKKAKLEIKYVDKSKEFRSKLKEQTDKRKLFRDLYFSILINYAKKGKINCIAQGTQSYSQAYNRVSNNCPNNDFFKSGLNLIEPVEGLAKDEIRRIAKELRLPKEIVYRKPFPGPGLLLRFQGGYSRQSLNIIREATSIIDEFSEKHSKHFKDCFQIFPFLCEATDVPFVDNKNKESRGSIILIRAVKSEKNGKLGSYLPFEIDYKIKLELVKSLMTIKDIARVCFDFTPKIGNNINFKHGGKIEYI
jgi:GMP synthase (glutamine-hydrolysing)